MKRISLTLATSFALMATTAFAQNITIFEVQKSGGVIVYEGNVTLQEAALLLGESQPPQGATGLVLESGRAPRWTSLSNRDLNEALDGEGEPPIKARDKAEEAEHNDPDHSPKDPDRANLEDPLTGLGGDNGAKIDPIPGYWIGEMMDQKVTDCPAGTAEALTAQLATLNGSKLAFTIDETFDPSNVLVDFVWEKTGTNSWLGNLKNTQGPGGFRVQWAMRVMSPTWIKTRQHVAIAVLGDACTVLTEVDYGRAN